MEKAQLCKSTYNNQLKQSIYLCHKRKMSQIWQVHTLWQSQSKRSHHDAHLHPLTNVHSKYQPSTHYGIKGINPDKILKLMVTMTIESRLHHDDAHPQPPTNVPTKYQLPTPYSFQDIAQTRFYRSRSLQQGQRSNEGHTMTLHTYTPPTNVPTKYQLPTPSGF